MFNTAIPEEAFNYDASIPVTILSLLLLISAGLALTAMITKNKELSVTLVFTGIALLVGALAISSSVIPYDKTSQFKTWTAERYGIVLKGNAADILNIGGTVIVDGKALHKTYNNDMKGFILTENETPVEEIQKTVTP